jgi:DNA-binding response OmpR family regulator
LLRLLATRQGETVSRIEIEDKLYGIDHFPNSNVVAATLSMLRGKLGEPPLIRTRRGLGYVMEAPES